MMDLISNLGLYPESVDCNKMQDVFEQLHSNDWLEEDFQTCGWDGFGFPYLPTMERYGVEIVLFITPIQAMSLEGIRLDLEWYTDCQFLEGFSLSDCIVAIWDGEKITETRFKEENGSCYLPE